MNINDFEAAKVNVTIIPGKILKTLRESHGDDSI